MNERGRTTTTFPGPSDYVTAVQDLQRAFHAPELRRAQFAVDPKWGIPMAASGSAAVVFRARINGVDEALRMFIKEDASEKRRYVALEQHFAIRGLRDCVAATSWIDDAVQVKGEWWPVIRMEWIEGRTLDSYVGHLVERGDAGALRALAAGWRSHIARLQSAEFAHGDLQHGNVLVDTSARLRLVDFDGSWIAAFESWSPPASPPSERGHPNYQHSDRTWGRWMDTFPALVIYTGLLVLSRRPDAWRSLYDGENIVFSSNDFLRPGDTRTWALLRGVTDPDVVPVVQRLQTCCAPQWRATGPLETLLAPERIHVPRPRPAPGAPPIFTGVSSAPEQWWYDAEPRSARSQSRPPAPPPAPPPGAMPAPPPKAVTPAANDAGPAFGGVSRPSSNVPPRPPVPLPRPAPAGSRSAGSAVAIATVVALGLGILLGAAVAASGGAGAAAALLTMALVFPITLAVLRR